MAISAAVVPSKTLSLSSTSGRKPIFPSSLSSSLASSSSFFFDDGSKRAGFRLTVKAQGRGNNRMRGLSCNCLFGLGVPELAVIAGVAALVFGPKNLPEVGRSFGKTIKSFQQAAKEFESELKEPESIAEPSPRKVVAETDEEKPKSVAVTEDNKQDVTVSSPRES